MKYIYFLILSINFFIISCAKNDKYDNYLTHNIKKILKLINIYQKKKSFITDPKGNKKNTFYKEINTSLSGKIYLEGYFESEKYFLDSKSNLIEEFKIKDEFIKRNISI